MKDTILIELDNKDFDIMITRMEREKVKEMKTNEKDIVVLYENLRNTMKEAVDETFGEEAQNKSYLINYIHRGTGQVLKIKDVK